MHRERAISFIWQCIKNGGIYACNSCKWIWAENVAKYELSNGLDGLKARWNVNKPNGQDNDKNARLTDCFAVAAAYVEMFDSTITSTVIHSIKR